MTADNVESVKRVAVADLGSQAFRLEVAEVSPEGVISSLYRERHPLMLARRGSFQQKEIDEIVDVLSRFAKTARNYNATLRAAGTAVFRAQSSDTRNQLVQEVKEKAGVHLRILSTEQEAAFSLRGTAGSMGITGRFLHLEVGGGSCQISLGSGLTMLQTVSVPTGAGSLTRWMESQGGQVDDVEVKASKYADGLMEPARSMAQQTAMGVGTGGTAKTLARLESLTKGKGEPAHRPIYLTRTGLKSLLQLFRTWSCPKRAADEYSLTRDRAEVLKAGALLMDAAMVATGLQELEICHDGIRAGLMRAEQDVWEHCPAF